MEEGGCLRLRCMRLLASGSADHGRCALAIILWRVLGAGLALVEGGVGLVIWDALLLVFGLEGICVFADCHPVECAPRL